MIGRGGGACLVLIGGDGPHAPMAWATVQASSGAVIDQGVVDASARGGVRAAAAARTILVIPASEAQLKRLELPARTEAQARAAAQYMFEDGLAGAAAMHYAVGAAQDETGARLVAAIDLDRLQGWLDRARTHGADPHIVALDCTVFDLNPGEALMVDRDDRTILAAGPYGGLSLEPSLARALVGRFISQTPQPILSLAYCGPDLAALQAWLDRSIAARRTEETDPIRLLAAAAVSATEVAPNLRQGALAPQANGSGLVGRWRVAAALAAVAILLHAGVQAAAGWREARAAEAVMTQAEAAFRQARPDVTRIVDLRAQVAALANTSSQAQRHPVIATNDPLSRALLANPTARLDDLRHDAPEKTVRVRLSAPQPEALTAVVEHLRAQGLAVTPGVQQTLFGRTTMDATLEASP